MPSPLSIRRVVLYKHGVGYFERRGKVTGSETAHLDFKARDMNDVLKSMTVLDLNGGSVSAVSYDSTKPLEQLLSEATIRIPEHGSLTALLGQVKGARVRARVGGAQVEGAIVGLESLPVVQGEASVVRPFLTLLVGASLRTFDVLELGELEFLDEAVRKDLEFYLATVMSSYKKDSKRLSILTAGEGSRELYVSYVLESPVWKTSYRILLDEGKPPLLQGWAMVDNTGDEDWVDVELSLIAGLPVSFVHDLYNPRYLRRPIVEVRSETGVAPVIPQEAHESFAEPLMETDDEGSFGSADMAPSASVMPAMAAPAPAPRMRAKGGPMIGGSGRGMRETLEQSTAVTTLTKEVGDLFEYGVDRPVTVHRNQSALVPILQRPFEGRRVLLYNRATREKNPMACIEFKNTTGLTLEGGPVTITEEETYVGEAMLDTLKPDDTRFVPYAVELSCVMSVEEDQEEGPVFRARLNRGTLVVEFFHQRRTKILARNKAKRPQVLFVEHPRTGWELKDTAAPAETTDGFWRFKRELAPGTSDTLVITERTRGHRQYYLGNLGLEEVTFFLDSRFIDPRVAQALRDVVAMREKQSSVTRELQRLNEERAQLFKDQERIRSNIDSLKSGASQRELVERFVTKLNAQEDRLESIGRELERLEEERTRLQAETNQRIESLSYEADL
ncbi:hypothetical protein D7X96_28300 [Corallococcus interemptor]|uniref:DUF4139 domain-containing protein n=1 Tax=Corallococcus interemptor TaxID=2316720 RepID=A0A3A8Q398_9BACT|nr:hypothetical protein [Corallococcus interemptor]RKH52474.1 hypothetical protein D7Y23_06965 [Corallococcus sp. AB050B]RKH63217.1 hypothetical protein D7X96_28300 [Corallococcus interemptor]